MIPRKAFYTNQTQNIYGSHVDTCKYNKDFSIEFELTQSKVVKLRRPVRLHYLKMTMKVL